MVVLNLPTLLAIAVSRHGSRQVLPGYAPVWRAGEPAALGLSPNAPVVLTRRQSKRGTNHWGRPATRALAYRSPAQEVESALRAALQIAEEQGALLLKLRAATSLARIWRDQDKREEARELLAPIYAWFTEGFDTLDLKEAKALLDDLHA
jgi:hypothetical protein